jgi:arginase
MNRVHPEHRAENFADYRHYILAFHDSTLECVAHELEWEIGPSSATRARLLTRSIEVLEGTALEPGPRSSRRSPGASRVDRGIRVKDLAHLFVFPQWQGAGDLPGLRDSALAIAAAISGNRSRIEVPVAAAHPVSREQGIEGRAELLAQLGRARELLEAEQPARVLAVGGDCGIEVAVISYLLTRDDGDLTVLWLDAHPDLNTPESSPSGHFHGMPLRVLLGEGDPEFTALVDRPLRTEQVILAGTRSFDPPELAIVERHGLRLFSPEQLGRNVAQLVGSIRGRVYLHLDLDVCEPRDVPSVACPTPDGVPVSTLIGLLDALAGSVDVVGAGVTEGLFDGPSVPSEIQPILERLARL